MDPEQTIYLVFIGGPIVALIIVGVLGHLVSGARPDPRLREQQRASGNGEWYARPHPGFGWGVLRIQGGHVSFQRDGADGPEWTVPAPEVTVWGPDLIGAYLTLQAEAIGRFRCEVSSSKGARWRQAGDVRDLHDRGVAEDIVAILTGYGARRA